MIYSFKINMGTAFKSIKSHTWPAGRKLDTLNYTLSNAYGVFPKTTTPVIWVLPGFGRLFVL